MRRRVFYFLGGFFVMFLHWFGFGFFDSGCVGRGSRCRSGISGENNSRERHGNDYGNNDGKNLLDFTFSGDGQK